MSLLRGRPFDIKCGWGSFFFFNKQNYFDNQCKKKKWFSLAGIADKNIEFVAEQKNNSDVKSPSPLDTKWSGPKSIVTLLIPIAMTLTTGYVCMFDMLHSGGSVLTYIICVIMYIRG